MDPIEIVAYDPGWPGAFRDMGSELRRALGSVALRIDHIGSTAIPDLAAKPVVDVQISVAALEPVDPFRLPLEELGYVFQAGNPERTKRYFREGPGRPRRHIHVRKAGSFHEQLALLFRDYMCAHAEEARSYEELKLTLAERYREDRIAYTDAKDPFIWEVMRRASLWAQETGWEPGPSDM